MKLVRLGVNLAAFAVVVGLGFAPKAACANGGCEEGVDWQSGCMSQCMAAWCATNMPIGAFQCNDGDEYCVECPYDDTKVRMSCVYFNT